MDLLFTSPKLSGTPSEVLPPDSKLTDSIDHVKVEDESGDIISSGEPVLLQREEKAVSLFIFPQ